MGNDRKCTWLNQYDNCVLPIPNKTCKSNGDFSKCQRNERGNGSDALCNQCPNCKSIYSEVTGNPKIAHNHTEIYVQLYCPDCRHDYKAVYQFSHIDN